MKIRQEASHEKDIPRKTTASRSKVEGPWSGRDRPGNGQQSGWFGQSRISQKYKNQAEECGSGVGEGRRDGGEANSPCLSKYFVAKYVKLDFRVLNSLDCKCQYTSSVQTLAKITALGEPKELKILSTCLFCLNKIKQNMVRYETFMINWLPSSTNKFTGISNLVHNGGQYPPESSLKIQI